MTDGVCCGGRKVGKGGECGGVGGVVRCSCCIASEGERVGYWIGLLEGFLVVGSVTAGESRPDGGGGGGCMAMIGFGFQLKGVK